MLYHAAAAELMPKGLAVALSGLYRPAVEEVSLGSRLLCTRTGGIIIVALLLVHLVISRTNFNHVLRVKAANADLKRILREL